MRKRITYESEHPSRPPTLIKDLLDVTSRCTHNHIFSHATHTLTLAHTDWLHLMWRWRGYTGLQFQRVCVRSCVSLSAGFKSIPRIIVSFLSSLSSSSSLSSWCMLFEMHIKHVSTIEYCIPTLLILNPRTWFPIPNTTHPHPNIPTQNTNTHTHSDTEFPSVQLFTIYSVVKPHGHTYTTHTWHVWFPSVFIAVSNKQTKWYWL